MGLSLGGGVDGLFLEYEDEGERGDEAEQRHEQRRGRVDVGAEGAEFEGESLGLWIFDSKEEREGEGGVIY